jgi:hypothetical protein
MKHYVFLSNNCKKGLGSRTFNATATKAFS